jgi:hypothetical protein
MKKKKTKQPQNYTCGTASADVSGIPKKLSAGNQLIALIRLDWAIASGLCFGLLSLYVFTLCPTIYVGDSAEFSAVAACWGVAHPPGYPLYSLLNGLFIRLLPIGEIAWRTNLFSAVCGSLAIGLMFLLCRRIGASLPAAAAAALCFGTGATFWSQAIVAEVYSIDILLILSAIFFVFRVHDYPNRRNYFLCGLISGLMVGHRIVNLVYIVPVIILFMADAWKRSGKPLSVFLYALIGAAVSGIVFLYLPVASFFNPPVDNGDPETLERFWDVIAAKSYQGFLGASPFMRELTRASGFFMMLPANLGVAAIAAPAGFWMLFRRGGWMLAGGIAYAAVCCIGFSAKYNIADISVYFLPALAMLALVAACGFDLLPGRFVWAAVLLGLVNLPLQYRSHDFSCARLGEQYGRDILTLAKPGAVILTPGDTVNNILVYLQSIQGVRPDVSIVLAFDYPPADWYAALQRRKYPHVNWPSQGSDYYLQNQQVQKGESWLKTLIRGNIDKHAFCLPDFPLVLLLKLKLMEFLPYWHEVPDGVLYCLDSPGQPFNIEQRIAGTQAFWDQHNDLSWRMSDGVDVELAALAFNYLKARFSFATVLASSDKISAALQQLRSIAASNPDRIEEKINAAYHTGMYRLGARAQKALAAPPDEKKIIQEQEALLKK